MANTRHNVLTGVELHYSKIYQTSTSPSDPPTYLGESYFDNLNNILYIATGVASVTDWQPVVGAGGGTNSIFDVSTTTYTVVAPDNTSVIRMTNTAARTVTLVTSPINGFSVSIQDGAGTASIANITVNSAGGDTFQGGGTSFTIDGNAQSSTFVYDVGSTAWIPTAAYLGRKPVLTSVSNIPGSDLNIQTTDTQHVNLISSGANIASVIPTGLVMNAAKPIFFNNSGNTFSTSLKGGANTGNVNLILPTTTPVAGQILVAAGSSQLVFANSSIPLANVVDNDSDVVFISTDNRFQNCLPTAARTYTLPSTGISAGDSWTFYNRSTSDTTGVPSTNLITLVAADTSVIGYCFPNGETTIQSVVNNPGISAGWIVVNSYSTGVVTTLTFGSKSGLLLTGTVNSQMIYTQNLNIMDIMIPIVITGATSAGGGQATFTAPIGASNLAPLNGLVTLNGNTTSTFINGWATPNMAAVLTQLSFVISNNTTTLDLTFHLRYYF